jgi:hypothetical protein
VSEPDPLALIADAARRYALRVIALGAGVQSSAMYLMACAGEIVPRPDCAIFADTQAEPPWVYEQLAYLRTQGGPPIAVVTVGSLEQAVLTAHNSTGGRFASVPFWVRGPDGRGMGRRQCTREYKIDPIKQEIRRMLGLQKRQRAAGRYVVEEWVGISLDEAHRAKPSRTSWISTRWPLLFDRPMRRADCLAWMRERGHPIPGRSACYFCPYRSNREWRDLRDNAPELFQRALGLDAAIRQNRARGIRGEQYLHDSLVPLADVDLDADLPDPKQADLFGNECEGMCGV